MKPPPEGTDPDDEQLSSAAALARDNAIGLVADARLLLDHGSFGRAHALSVLALEELGKTMLCLEALLGQLSREAIRSLWSQHAPKLWRGHMVALLYADSYRTTRDIIERFEQTVKSDAAVKLRGFYVDLTADRIAVPDEISEAQATEIVTVVEEVTAVARQMDLAGAHLKLSSDAREEIQTAQQAVSESLQATSDAIESLPQDERPAAEVRTRASIDDLVHDVRAILADSGGDDSCPPAASTRREVVQMGVEGEPAPSRPPSSYQPLHGTRRDDRPSEADTGAR